MLSFIIIFHCYTDGLKCNTQNRNYEFRNAISIFLTILSFSEMNEQVSYPVSRLDRISALPDGIICTILSNLPLEESARMSILPKRWCKIWPLSPITISDVSILEQSHTYSTQECSSYFSWLINTHPTSFLPILGLFIVAISFCLYGMTTSKP